jgi:hypothetical protein
MDNPKKVKVSKYLVVLFTALFFAGGIPIAHAQNFTKQVKKTRVSQVKTTDVPPWAEAQHYTATAHAYFPDYYVYYDAKRRGYVYWESGAWRFTPAVPPFLEKVDLRKTRIRLVEGLSLDLYPQRSYPRMMKLYPADPQNILVPVPTPLHGKP